MGGLQAILSLALILGPALAGLAFDYVGIPAPYLIGGTLVLLVLIFSGAAQFSRRSDEGPQGVRASG